MSPAWKNLLLGGALAAVVLGPIALRPRTDRQARDVSRVLTVVTPHHEAIRAEFGRAFEEHHFARTGERIQVVWRTPGGTSEIARYLDAEYISAFRQHWRNLGREWSGQVEKAFTNAKLTPDDTPQDDTAEEAARREFLSSNVGCRIDAFFGGGAFDYIAQAGAGRLVDSGVVAAHPDLFNPDVIPQNVGGEPYWDPKGRWIGTCLSAFGICYNADSIRRIGIAEPPRRWSDLADPRYFRQIALANPTQSSSVNRAFELLIQQQMQQSVAERSAGRTLSEAEEKQAVAEGWTKAMQLLMKIGANARYFTDASNKVSLDVSAGEAAAGMTIDFYGRFESEAVRRPDGSSRLVYVNAEGGTSFGVDPVGMLRGAPDPDLAREFIAWLVSPDGQKLWNWKVGAPGGPKTYALRRLPVLPSLYAADFFPHRSDPDVQPYALAGKFTYRDKWTGPLFKPIGFIVRVMCIDCHDELAAAWQALAAAGFPPEATAIFSDVSAVDYATAQTRVREALGPNKIREVELARELADRFRAQYRRAAELARAGR